MSDMPENLGMILLPIARHTISNALVSIQSGASEDSPWLSEKGACFVTLVQNNNLRGCIGTLEAHRPLLMDVKANAHAAAFLDFRFSPLTREELDNTRIEISLLSPIQEIAFSSQQEALAQLQPGIDGVLFKYGRFRSTFLPQVWEQIPDINEFMSHLKYKAGLAPDFWDENVKLYRYNVRKWKEEGIQQSVKMQVADEGLMK